MQICLVALFFARGAQSHEDESLLLLQPGIGAVCSLEGPELDIPHPRHSPSFRTTSVDAFAFFSVPDYYK